jgi:2-polyprenyl-3-methyl-5-hydroxy-6-metoxy-1,4-benzoquinol methylase
MDRSAYQAYEELERTHFWRVGKRRLILEWLDRYHERDEAGHVLDIGGCCSLICRALPRYGHVSVVEPEPSMIRLARSLHSEEIEFVEGHLPGALPDGPFTLITLFDVLEHVDDDRGALDAIFERLTVGGTLALTVPAVKLLWSDHDVALHHKRRYQKRELHTLLRAAGFEIVRMSFYTSLLFPLATVIRLVSRLRPKRTERASEYTVRTPRAFVNHLLSYAMTIERFLLRHVDLPVGLSLIAIAQRPADSRMTGHPPIRRERDYPHGPWRVPHGDRGNAPGDR